MRLTASPATGHPGGERHGGSGFIILVNLKQWTPVSSEESKWHGVPHSPLLAGISLCTDL